MHTNRYINILNFSICFKIYLQYCSGYGSLVSVLSTAEQLFLQSIVKSTYWLGANRETSSKGWQWSDNSPFIFTNWAVGEYSTNKNQYCAAISNELAGQWKTVTCDSKLNTICKKLSIYATPVEVTTAYPIKPEFLYGCQEGWTQSGKTNYCYKYFGTQSDLLSFDKARMACKEENADLVEILGENENQFVVSLLHGSKRNSRNKQVELECPGNIFSKK